MLCSQSSRFTHSRLYWREFLPISFKISFVIRHFVWLAISFTYPTDRKWIVTSQTHLYTQFSFFRDGWKRKQSSLLNGLWIKNINFIVATVGAGVQVIDTCAKWVCLELSLFLNLSLVSKEAQRDMTVIGDYSATGFRDLDVAPDGGLIPPSSHKRGSLSFFFNISIEYGNILEFFSSSSPSFYFDFERRNQLWSHGRLERAQLIRLGRWSEIKV